LGALGPGPPGPLDKTALPSICDATTGWARPVPGNVLAFPCS